MSCAICGCSIPTSLVKVSGKDLYFCNEPTPYGESHAVTYIRCSHDKSIEAHSNNPISKVPIKCAYKGCLENNPYSLGLSHSEQGNFYLCWKHSLQCANDTFEYIVGNNGSFTSLLFPPTFSKDSKNNPALSPPTQSVAIHKISEILAPHQSSSSPPEFPEHFISYPNTKVYCSHLTQYIGWERNVAVKTCKYTIYQGTLVGQHKTNSDEYLFHISFTLARAIMIGHTFYVHAFQPGLVFRKTDKSWIPFCVYFIEKIRGMIVAGMINEREVGGYLPHAAFEKILHNDNSIVAIALDPNSVDFARQNNAITRFSKCSSSETAQRSANPVGEGPKNDEEFSQNEIEEKNEIFREAEIECKVEINEAIKRGIIGRIASDHDGTDQTEFSQLNTLSPNDVIPISIPPGPNPDRSQQRAAEYALSHHFSTIQGPPGTGKSTLVTVIVHSLLQAHKRVGVFTHTNAAADILARKLEGSGDGPYRLVSLVYEYNAPLDILKLAAHRGYKADGDEAPNFKRSDFEVKFSQHAKYLNALGDNDKDLKPVYDWSIEKGRTAPLIVTTLSCAGSSLGVLSGSFDAIIVDEAGQCLDSYLLIPLMRSPTPKISARSVEHLILLGDHKQLQPFLMAGALRRAHFNNSLMHRSVLYGLQPQILTFQYRMHPAIANFASMRFYGGAVQNGITADDRKEPKPVFPFPNPEFPLMFWDVPGEERPSPSGKSFLNLNQTRAAIEAAICLMTNGVEGKDISLIMPYLGEADFLHENFYEMFEKRFLEECQDIKFNTVDSFQGHESKYVIYISVRSNSSKTIGFLSDDGRVNVSLTRAQYGLIVIGDSQMFTHNKTWAYFIMYCQKNCALCRGQLGQWKHFQFTPDADLTDDIDDFSERPPIE